jgi:hypothetical protein
MAQQTNTAAIQYNNSSNTNNFYNNVITGQPLALSANMNSALLAEFEKITNNKQSAKILASAVIYTCQQQQLDVMQTLDEFIKLGKTNALNEYLCLFLNLSRIGTSYLGVKKEITTNKYVNRTILL